MTPFKKRWGKYNTDKKALNKKKGKKEKPGAYRHRAGEMCGILPVYKISYQNKYLCSL